MLDKSRSVAQRRELVGRSSDDGSPFQGPKQEDGVQERCGWCMRNRYAAQHKSKFKFARHKVSWLH